MLNIYDLDKQQVANELLKNKILAAVHNNQIVIMGGKVEQSQAVIDRMYYGVADLIPTQFYFLLAKSGLDVAINTLLTSLQSEDLNKYAMYKAYFTGARYYEFSKAYHMYLDIKAKILVVDSNLDFTLQQLKTLWTEVSEEQL